MNVCRWCKKQQVYVKWKNNFVEIYDDLTFFICSADTDCQSVKMLQQKRI